MYDATKEKAKYSKEKAYVIDSSGLVIMSSQRNVSNLALNLMTYWRSTGFRLVDGSKVSESGRRKIC